MKKYFDVDSEFIGTLKKNLEAKSVTERNEKINIPCLVNDST